MSKADEWVARDCRRAVKEASFYLAKRDLVFAGMWLGRANDYIRGVESLELRAKLSAEVARWRHIALDQQAKSTVWELPIASELLDEQRRLTGCE